MTKINTTSDGNLCRLTMQQKPSHAEQRITILENACPVKKRHAPRQKLTMQGLACYPVNHFEIIVDKTSYRHGTPPSSSFTEKPSPFKNTRTSLDNCVSLHEWCQASIAAILDEVSNWTHHLQTCHIFRPSPDQVSSHLVKFWAIHEMSPLIEPRKNFHVAIFSMLIWYEKRSRWPSNVFSSEK